MGYENAKSAFGQSARAKQHMAEAQFGKSHVEAEINALPQNASVLEVGAGAGILLCELAMLRPDVSFLGLEPTGEGFNYTTPFHDLANSLDNAQLKNCGYEALGNETQYDLIYLINVFEHLPDWEDFLGRLARLLKANGKCIILCPNYSFPYEPHFRLPIIFNKKVSQRLFARQIEKLENDEQAAGLWSSLNFVKYRHVISTSKKLGLSVFFDKKIITNMIERLDTDKSFLDRQKILKLPVWIAQKTGLISALPRSRLFEPWLHYMHLAITKTKSPQHHMTEAE